MKCSLNSHVRPSHNHRFARRISTRANSIKIFITLLSCDVCVCSCTKYRHVIHLVPLQSIWICWQSTIETHFCSISTSKSARKCRLLQNRELRDLQNTFKHLQSDKTLWSSISSQKCFSLPQTRYCT